MTQQSVLQLVVNWEVFANITLCSTCYLYSVCRDVSNNCNPGKWHPADVTWKPNEVAVYDESTNPGSGTHSSSTDGWHYVDPEKKRQERRRMNDKIPVCMSYKLGKSLFGCV